MKLIEKIDLFATYFQQGSEEPGLMTPEDRKIIVHLALQICCEIIKDPSDIYSFIRGLNESSIVHHGLISGVKPDQSEY